MSSLHVVGQRVPDALDMLKTETSASIDTFRKRQADILALRICAVQVACSMPISLLSPTLAHNLHRKLTKPLLTCRFAREPQSFVHVSSEVSLVLAQEVGRPIRVGTTEEWVTVPTLEVEVERVRDGRVREHIC